MIRIATRLIPPLGVPLILAIGLGQGDTRLPAALPAALGYGPLSSLAPLPGTPAQTLVPHVLVPAPRITRCPALPSARSPRTPGDVMPHSYLVFGLRTGPGGMAFTDRNGAVIPVPSNARVFLVPAQVWPVASAVQPAGPVRP